MCNGAGAETAAAANGLAAGFAGGVGGGAAPAANGFGALGSGAASAAGASAAAAPALAVAAPISTTTRVSPSSTSSPFCSWVLLTFLPLTMVPAAEPRSMMKISSGEVTSITACIRETLSSSMRRWLDGSLPTLMMSCVSVSVRSSSSPL
ncbi:MAG: hypothetical protein M5U28_06655 [Sandaracinaceae bacterium]|nr:hypothetical protein [Sandaracinaceae bacterium]